MKTKAILIILFATLCFGCQKKKEAVESSASLKDSGKTSAASKPNILIIMADDLDTKQLSCYGGQNLNTKNIDALAAEGKKFNQIIASEAMCVPTRASLFTGLYPVKHGAYQNHKPVYGNLKSVNQYLRNLGYRVGLSGKDHVTTPQNVFPFDIVPGFEKKCVSPTDNYSLTGIRNYINQASPFCLFVMSINPHSPWVSGDPTEFDQSTLKLPAHWVDTKRTRTQFRNYLAEVRRLDNQVGDIMKMLKETGKDQNTVVIFLGEQGAAFPGGKWNLYDYAQKSSMIVKWPGIVQPNTQTPAIVQYEDITPTLIDIAGGNPISGLAGKSFKKVLNGTTNVLRDVAYGIHNNIPEGTHYAIRSIRDKQYKLLLNLTPNLSYYIKYSMNPNDENLWASWVDRAQTVERAKFLTDRITTRPAMEFYNLTVDPDELDNLADKPEYQALINQYKTKLRAWMNEQGDTGASMDVPFEGDIPDED